MRWRVAVAVAAVLAVAGAVTSAAAYTKFHGRPKPAYNGTTPYTKHFVFGGRADMTCDGTDNSVDTALDSAFMTDHTPFAEYVTPCVVGQAVFTGPTGANPIPRDRADVNGDHTVNAGDTAFIAHYYGPLRDKTKPPSTSTHTGTRR